MKHYFRFVKFLCIFFSVAVFGTLIVAPMWVINSGKNNIYQKQSDIPVYRVGIVFGAGITTRGEPKEMLKHRLDVAAELYGQKKLKKILVSGDNRVAEYNEPAAMFSYLTEEKQIPEEDVIRDYAGRRTYDTCIRARDIWGVKKALIITQGYHAIRAVFTCNALGVESTGFSATRNSYARERDFKIRELMAIYKALIDIYLWTPDYVGGNPEQSLENDEEGVARSATSEAIPTHAAFYGGDEFYNDVFSSEDVIQQDISEEKNISALIINHHLLAPNLIGQTFKAASRQNPSVVVLVSPNHFSAGKSAILTSAYDWKMPYGKLSADQELIKTLTEKTNIQIDEAPFEKEHGIFNIVTFIKGTFPDTKIVPLIIKDIVPGEDARKLAHELADILPSDALVVGSFDFSHYLPENIAAFHDVQSENMLETLDTEYAYRSDIDSRPGITSIIEYAKKRGAENFITLKRSSAAHITKNYETKENTSYIVGYFSGEKQVPEPKATILAMGDVFLDRYIRQAIEQKGKEYLFADLDRFFTGQDVTLANIEGPFTNFTPKPLDPNNTTFTFAPEMAPYLKSLGFNMTSLANNHTLDFGKDGLEQTKNVLQEARIESFGDPKNISNTTIKNIRGKKIAFIGFHEFARTPIAQTVQEIEKAEKEADFTIVMPHWGIEYADQPSQNQKDEAYAFIDAGADLILGAHPHVIQPIEIYKEKAIFYSLGNFLFDQVAPGTTEGLVVGVEIGEENISFTLITTQTKNAQVSFLFGAKRDTLLQKLGSSVPVYAGDIRKGAFSLSLKK